MIHFELIKSLLKSMLQLMVSVFHLKEKKKQNGDVLNRNLAILF